MSNYQKSNGGSIVNISSDLGLIALIRFVCKRGPSNKQPVKPVTYSVIKTGLIGLTRYLSTYWADKNVRCNTICQEELKMDNQKNFGRN